MQPRVPVQCRRSRAFQTALARFRSGHLRAREDLRLDAYLDYKHATNSLCIKKRGCFLMYSGEGMYPGEDIDDSNPDPTAH
ncbi:hypothetical protein TNCV_4751081 [Trichonephila clavipes]|nr:hypothetical protein TNCV_4751081 [Trichonephila clavipes]